MIAEVGIWRNALSPDPNERRKNMDYCVEQLRMADFIGAKCCVNVSGAFGKRWDGAYKENFSKHAREEIIKMVRDCTGLHTEDDMFGSDAYKRYLIAVTAFDLHRKLKGKEV